MSLAFQQSQLDQLDLAVELLQQAQLSLASRSGGQAGSLPKTYLHETEPLVAWQAQATGLSFFDCKRGSNFHARTKANMSTLTECSGTTYKACQQHCQWSQGKVRGARFISLKFTRKRLST